MSRFKGLAAAKTFESGTYLTEGDYRVEVQKVFVKATRKDGDAFIVEYKVTETSNPEKHPIGATRSWYQSMKDKDIAFSAMKGFFAAMLKLDTHNEKEMAQLDAQIEDVAEKAVSENALKDQSVNVKCWNKVTKEKKKDFTVHQFSPTT